MVLIVKDDNSTMMFGTFEDGDTPNVETVWINSFS